MHVTIASVLWICVLMDYFFLVYPVPFQLLDTLALHISPKVIYPAVVSAGCWGLTALSCDHHMTHLFIV